MTALKQYERLECGGLWRAVGDQQRLDVTVSFGDATLVISDGAGRPLTHWSLPAIDRVNPGERPALYSPDPERSETLELSDTMMIDALEKVRRSLARRQPRPGRVRNAGIAFSVAAMLGLGVFWLPGALVEQTLKVVPLSKRSEIGATTLGHLQRLTGPTCRSAQGTQALARFKTRVLGAEDTAQIVVVPNRLKGAILLPGRIVVVSRDLIEGQDDPAVLAGYVLAAVTARIDHDPLDAILLQAGLGTTMRLLTTGELPTDTLRSYAERVLTAPPPEATTAELIAAFTAANVPITPYANAMDPTGEATVALTKADPFAGQPGPVILTDGDWVALQGICA